MFVSDTLMENFPTKVRLRLYSELSCHLQIKDVHSFLGIEDGEEAPGQGIYNICMYQDKIKPFLTFKSCVICLTRKLVLLASILVQNMKIQSPLQVEGLARTSTCRMLSTLRKHPSIWR